MALLCSLALLGPAGPVRGASSLRLSAPNGFGVIEAATLDTEGIPIGPARMEMARAPGGRVVLRAESAIAGKESVRLHALLEPADAGALRLVTQRAQTFDPAGALLFEMSVDHEESQASCFSRRGQQTLPIDDGDRIANVPISLLLLPLARGEQAQIDFEVIVCRGGPRLIEVAARRTGRVVHTTEHTEAVEIEYLVQLGPILAQLARPFLPRILFWIDPAAEPLPWIAQQMPLYPKGPTVLVVRSELAPELFLTR